MRPLLVVKNLNVSMYKRPVLRDVSFEIMPNQVFVLMGPGGAGKSTIMRTACGLFGGQKNATIDGQIHYKGRVIHPGHAPTLVIQTARMLLGTVLDNLSEQFPNRGALTHAQLLQQITQFLCKLDLVDLADSLDVEVLDLTKLQRKKLLIANALLEKPALIALDDPTIDLDESQAGKLLEFIESLTRKYTVMMCTNNQHHARAIGSVICLVAGGRIQECRPVDEFFSNPQSQAARDYIRTGTCTVPAINAEPETTEPESLEHDYFSDIDSDGYLDEIPEIELAPLHSGPITEPNFGSLPSKRTATEEERSFIGARPKTLTSIPVHTENYDDLPTVNEIPFDNDVFAVIEDMYLNKGSRFLTRITKRSQPQSPEKTSDTRGPRDFRWLRPGVLAGTPQPGLLVDIRQDLMALQRVGVTHLITLTEEPLHNAPLQDFNIQNIHFPIADMEAPDLQMAAELCASIADLIAHHAVIAYHCHAGIGRTGTMLVAQLIWEGLDANTALNQARSIYSPWVQSQAQENFLIEFERSIRA